MHYLISLFSILSFLLPLSHSLGNGLGISGGTPAIEYLNIRDQYIFAPEINFRLTEKKLNEFSYQSFNDRIKVTIEILKNSECNLVNNKLCLYSMEKNKIVGYKQLPNQKVLKIDMTTNLEGIDLINEFKKMDTQIKILK